VKTLELCRVSDPQAADERTPTVRLTSVTSQQVEKLCDDDDEGNRRSMASHWPKHAESHCQMTTSHAPPESTGSFIARAESEVLDPLSLATRGPAVFYRLEEVIIRGPSVALQAIYADSLTC
jgi:hypothetical protein